MRLFGKLRAAFAICLMTTAWTFAADNVSSRSDGKLAREAQPIRLMRDVLQEEYSVMPAGTPIQRYHIDRDGGRVIDGGTAGATGTLVYKNTMGTNFFAPGTNTQIADDILTIASGGCDMSFLEVLVTGGGNGSGPGFNATFALLTACPGQGGTVIPGTTLTEMLPNNGAWLVSLDLEGMEVAIPENPWLRMSFSNATAGWVFGRPAEVGFTGNIFHHPQFPCNTIFQGGVPYSGFYAEIWCGGDVETQFEAYRANEFSGFLDVLTATDLWADDIVPITSPSQCEFVRYDSDIAGLMGNYSMKIELYTNDTTDTTPLAPIMGTAQTCNGAGGGALVTCSKTVFPGIMIPTSEFWVGYDLLTGTQAGPILVADFPAVGDSEDGFSIFGNPDAGQWSPPVWWYGGCPDVDGAGDPVPCGTFQNTIYCAGTPPLGACCDVVSSNKNDCTDDVSVAQCLDGRWMIDATCGAATFDPPCGTASCCKPDGSCEDLTSDACATASGTWQPGQFCGLDTQTCPPGACITATNACSEENNNAGGCADIDCCSTVCSVDAFCCDTAWDSSCVGIAAASCDPTAPNDACAAAIAVGNGIFNFDTTLATTDGPGLPESCDEGFGNAFGQDVWFDYTAPMSGMATVNLCDGTEYDSRMSVYTGCTCPVTNAVLAGCNDDNCGDPVVVGGASSVTFPVTMGTCYKLRIGGFGAAVGTGSGEITTAAGVNCPNGTVTFVNPPNNAVDARQPHPVNSTTPAQGITTFTVTAPTGAGAACWSVCETASAGAPIAITNVSEAAGTYTVTLSRPITAGAVTRLTYNANSGPTTGAVISHPGNINGDSTAAPTDILRIIDCLNGLNPAANCPWGLLSQDTDRSGVFGPSDILRDIDMLNGADAFIVWNNTSLPTGACP